MLRMLFNLKIIKIKYQNHCFKGSLTVPHCQENTRWIISRNILQISETQLSQFRSLKTNDIDVDYLRDNFRPTQSLNSRKVYLRQHQEQQQFLLDETAVTILSSSVIGIATFNIVYSYLTDPQTIGSILEFLFVFFS